MNCRNHALGRRHLARVKIASSLVLALISCARAVAADSITFSEDYTERVTSDHEIIVAHAGSFKAALTHPELGCIPLTGGMPLAISIGGLNFESPLGAADVITSSQFTFYMRDEFGRRIGTITLQRNFSQLLISGTFSRLPTSIVAGNFLGDAGPVSGITDARILFGDYEMSRLAYFSGRQTVTPRVIGEKLCELHSITLTGKADYARPVVSISSPRPDQRLEDGTIAMTGIVKDNVAASWVQVQVNGADMDPVSPDKSGFWGNVIGLVPGTNVIAAWATDENGNASATNTLKVFRVVPAYLTLTWDGEGTMAGLTEGQLLEVGRSYKITARPAAAARFGGWSGGGEYGPVQSAEAALNFIMQPGMALHASFIPPVLEPLTLEVPPGNEVLGVTNGAPLEIGRVYQATVRPGPGNLFLGWVGSIQSSNTTLRFVMQSNMVLRAYIVPNPYLPIAGNYAGLVTEDAFEDSSLPPLKSGSFVLTLTDNGRITGKLRMRGQTLPFSGQATLDRFALVRVKRPKCIEPLLLELYFDVTGEFTVSGYVSSPTIYSSLAGFRGSSDVTYAGRYTFRILGADEEDEGSPDGEGVGTIVVDAHGIAKVSGTLGDGTPFTFSTPVFQNGFSPFETPVYGGRGLMLGWVSFAANGPLHVEGYDMVWFKPLSAADRYYPGGFVTHRYLMATRYTPPAPGSSALNWSEGVVGFNGGEFSDVLGVGIHITNNIVRPTDGFPKVTVTLAPKTGLLTVSLIHPFTLKTLSGKGAVLQFAPPYEGFGYPISGMGAGWFRGATESGFVRLLPLPPAEAR